MMSTAARAYFDYNATAPLRPEAREAVLSALDCVGNPSSIHGEGRKARAVIEKARSEVAGLVNKAGKNVIFTSGATEANATVISQPRFTNIAVGGTEHPSVLEAARRREDIVTVLPVDRSGIIELPALSAWLADSDDQPARLVSVQWANNETGVIQPIREIAQTVRDHNARLHVDAVQVAGRLAVDLSEVEIAFLTLSSHKIGGPHGVGAIVQGPGGELRTPMLVGGGQESRLRAGTENVAGIAGFGAAAMCAARDLSEVSKVSASRDRLQSEILRMTPGAVVVGSAAARLPNTLALVLPGLRAETLVIAFDLAGIALSSGAACSSGKVSRSHVLAAMGFGDELAGSALRISLGWATTEDEVERFLAAWAKVMKTDRAACQVA